MVKRFKKINVLMVLRMGISIIEDKLEEGHTNE